MAANAPPLQFRAFYLYSNGVKMAEVQDASFSIAANDEEVYGTDGLLGYTDGITTSKLDATLVIPLRGTKTDDVTNMLLKKYITMGIQGAARIFQVDMRVLSVDYSWDSKSGKATGKFSFAGGEPNVT